MATPPEPPNMHLLCQVGYLLVPPPNVVPKVTWLVLLIPWAPFFEPSLTWSRDGFPVLLCTDVLQGFLGSLPCLRDEVSKLSPASQIPHGSLFLRCYLKGVNADLCQTFHDSGGWEGEVRIKGEREGGERERRGGEGLEGSWRQGDDWGPSPLRPGAEDQRPLQPEAPARLAVPGPLAASFVHFDEQILDVLDLPLHRLRPLPQLPVPRLQPLALALQGLALCTLPLAVPQSRGLVLVSLLLLAVPSAGSRTGVGGGAGRGRGLRRWGQGRQSRVPLPSLTAAVDGQQVEGVQGRGLGEVKGGQGEGEGEREGRCRCRRLRRRRRWGGWWEQRGIEEVVFHLLQLLLEQGGHSFQVRWGWGRWGEGT